MLSGLYSHVWLWTRRRRLNWLPDYGIRWWWNDNHRVRRLLTLRNEQYQSEHAQRRGRLDRTPPFDAHIAWQQCGETGGTQREKNGEYQELGGSRVWRP